MYHLSSLRNLSQINLKLLTIPQYVENGFFKYYYCRNTLVDNLNNSNNLNGKKSLHFRKLSTTPNADLIRLEKIKKRRSSYKKYTELLQVTEKSTTQTKTTVQKLKSKKLQNFIERPKLLPINTIKDNKNVTSKKKINDQLALSRTSLEYNKYSLDMFDLTNKINEEEPVVFVGSNVDTFKLLKENDLVREIMESFITFKEVNDSAYLIPTEEQIEMLSNIKPSISSSYMEEEADMYTPEIIEPMEINTNILREDSSIKNKKNENSNSSYKSKYHKTFEHERLSKQYSLRSNLSSYTETCIYTGMLNRAMATVMNYRFKNKKYCLQHNIKIDNKIIDIHLYNLLLHGYAEKGNLGKVIEIYNIILEDNIKPTYQTYAAVFECIGRLKTNHEHIKTLNKIYADAQNQNFTLNDIIDKSKFASDQREATLSAIRLIHKDFKTIYTPPINLYDNKLLNKLNKGVLPIDTNNEKMDESVDNTIMESKRGFSSEQLVEFGREQLQIELDGFVRVKSIENFEEPNDLVKNYRIKLNELNELWHSQICAAFNRDLSTLRAQTQSKSNRTINLFSYLKVLDTRQYADILLKEVRQLSEGSETYSPTVGMLYRNLGSKVQSRYLIELKKRNNLLDKMGEVYGEYCVNLAQCKSSDNSRQLWQRLVYNNCDNGPNMDICDKLWPTGVCYSIGRFLYNILMRDLKIDVNILRTNSKSKNLLPAFYTLFRNQGRLVKEEVKAHPVLAKLYRGSQQEFLNFDANLVPMICPPQPWSTPNNGGYLLTKSELIRLPNQAFQQWKRIVDAPTADLFPALDSLNQLASIPWKVNTNVLDIILQVFNSGGNDKLDVPRPSHTLEPLKSDNSDNSKTNKFEIFRKKLAYRRKQAEMYSLWCDALYRLSLANHFRNKVFWLPHNMDFRGRVYPLPPHLNHLGSDLARSLLVFHQAKPLGPDGFNWLKLHCINLTGLKKRSSVKNRLLYADEIMDDILDSADNPLTGRMWWSKSDEPWQTLSCCIEVAKVYRSDDRENYMSHFPIHQDGSCNGLQHYAALGRDEAGAISVNLAPSELPQDVYSAVAALVEDARERDSKNGVQVAQILSGFVKRKVIKQTVMTTVYGVTRYGARLQIARQLKDLDNFPKEWVWPASSYLTTKTFESLREMFTSTKEIQDWFTDCARQISAICGQNVEWITPLGLPVVQPYSRFDKQTLPKSNQVKENFSMDLYEKPNIMKQKNAFPPNFIHSLDSCHMMLTSLNCEKAGITFISVHDCYWTHPCNVDLMNKICREQFVLLHSEKILENLSEFLIQKYGFDKMQLKNDGSVLFLAKNRLNNILNHLPNKGNFDLRNVLDSIYFFS